MNCDCIEAQRAILEQAASMLRVEAAKLRAMPFGGTAGDWFDDAAERILELRPEQPPNQVSDRGEPTTFRGNLIIDTRPSLPSVDRPIRSHDDYHEW